MPGALDPNVGAALQAAIDNGYQRFIHKVAAARHKTPDQIDAIAQGRVWSGKQAQERGLVDKIGGLEDATAAAAQAANLGSNYRVTYVEKPLTLWERVAMNMSNDALVSFAFNLGLGNLAGSTMLRKLNGLDYEGAADEMLRWDKAGGKVLAGLTRRRRAEKALFLEA